MKSKFDIDSYVELSGRVGYGPINQSLKEIVTILSKYHISFSDSAKLLSLADSLYTMKDLGVPMDFPGCEKDKQNKGVGETVKSFFGL